PVVVISHSFWLQQLGADPDVRGKAIKLNGIDFTVVGVAASGFRNEPGYGTGPSMWVPVQWQPQLEPGRGWINSMATERMRMFARLNTTADFATARAEFVVMEQQFLLDNPLIKRDYHAFPAGLTRGFSFMAWRGETAGLAIAVLTAFGFVLLIACANVVNLFLARATTRRKEIAIRVALGASRGRLIRQMLADSAIVAFLGGLLGLVFANWTLHAITPLASEFLSSYKSLDVQLDWRVIGYTLLLTCSAGVLFGLIPALQVSASAFNSDLKEDSILLGLPLPATRLREALIVGQIATCFVLVTGATLVMRAVQSGSSRNYGFNAAQVVMMRCDLSQRGYSPAQVSLFYRDITERLNTIPGIKSISQASLGWSPTTEIQIEGQSKNHRASQTFVSSGYFGTLEQSMAEGRGFTEHEIRDSAQVLVIAESLAKTYWPGKSAIGKRIRPSVLAPFSEVVGVVRDGVASGVKRRIRNGKLQALFSGFSADIYSPISPALTNSAATSILISTSLNPTALMPVLRHEVNVLDPSLPVYLTGLRDALELWVKPLAIFGTVGVAMGALALLLASLGIHGIVAYSVSQRTREFGIRMALGAAPGTVQLLVLKQGLNLTLLGSFIGLLGSLALTRILSSILFGLNPFDPVSFALVAVLFALVTWLACWFPSQRAASIAPIEALRHE
ncbi:MAG: permease, partial [Verrucomicrobiales bacterium]|nr:permease [Verrucomicrobiales bacterium]